MWCAWLHTHTHRDTHHDSALRADELTSDSDRRVAIQTVIYILYIPYFHCCFIFAALFCIHGLTCMRVWCVSSIWIRSELYFQLGKASGTSACVPCARTMQQRRDHKAFSFRCCTWTVATSSCVHYRLQFYWLLLAFHCIACECMIRSDPDETHR